MTNMNEFEKKRFLRLNFNRKFELMLTRCAKAYSSSGSVV